MTPARTDVAIIGSGFAASILARMLLRRGKRVVLLERERHPRFAIGESATPLAGLTLERIAADYDLPDLADLATYGRWSQQLPGLRRGLKRGFSFYAHRPGEPYANSAENDSRLLVAASPEDDVADTHWLRSDVDAYLAARAMEEGAELLEGADATSVSLSEDAVVVMGDRDGAPFRVEAATIVDASGSGTLLADAAGSGAAFPATEVASGLVGAHFEGVRSFVEIAQGGGASFEGAPYPEERAAVHHLIEEGWMYVLPFDHGVASAGLVLREPFARAAAVPHARAALFYSILARYPTLASSFRDAVPVSDWLGTARLQRRLAVAAGPRWVLLPHAYAFFDPLFSTGIAWSLFGVERAARLLAAESPPDPTRHAGYASLLSLEADQIGRMIGGALRAAGHFRLFCAWSFLYFALVAWIETRSRLGLETPEGFLAADRPAFRQLLIDARRELEAVLAAPDESAISRFEVWVANRIATFDVVGLSDPARRNLYPVDLEALVARADRLGMTREAMRAAVPDLLRSAGRRCERPLR